METPSDTESLAEILLDDRNHPRRAAHKTLNWLLGKINARSIALWRIEGDEIALTMGAAIDSLSETTARELWARRTEQPEAPIWGDDPAAILMRLHPAEILIFADGVRRNGLDLGSFVRGATIAATALRKAAGGSIIDVIEIGSSARKEELLSSLKLHEWNIARVARANNVTRKTVYDRMARYGIIRQRVPK